MKYFDTFCLALENRGRTYLTDDMRPSSGIIEGERLERATIRTIQDVEAILTPLLKYKATEHCVVIALSGSNNGLITGVYEVSSGDAHHCLMDTRGVMAFLLMKGVDSFIIAHNHPNSLSTPSPEDIAAAKRLLNVADMLGMTMLDSVVISSMSDGVVSFREKGYL